MKYAGIIIGGTIGVCVSAYLAFGTSLLENLPGAEATLVGLVIGSLCTVIGVCLALWLIRGE
jgi:hypothetical protein